METVNNGKLSERKRYFEAGQIRLTDAEVAEKKIEGRIRFATYHLLAALAFVVIASLFLFIISKATTFALAIFYPEISFHLPTVWILVLPIMAYGGLLFSNDPHSQNPSFRINDLLDLRCRWNLEEKNEYNVEVFGRYCGTFKPGMFIKIPFGFTTKIKVIPMYMQEESLFADMDEQADLLELAGGNSVGLSAKIFFVVIDSYRACYAPDNYVSNITQRAEGAIRAFLGGKSFDEANQTRHEYNHDVGKIMGGEEIDILALFGVSVTDVIIEDFRLPDGEIAAREEVFKAQQQVKVTEQKVEMAKQELKIADLKAQATQLTLEKSGAGFAAKVKALVDQNISPEKAVEMVTAIEKYEAIKVNKGVVIMDLGNNSGGGSDSELVKQGAALALGMQSVINSNKPAEGTQSNV